MKNNLETLERKVQEMQAEIDRLKQEEYSAQTGVCFKRPYEKRKLYCISSGGNIDGTYSNSTLLGQFTQGNVFYDRESAEKTRDARELFVKMKKASLDSLNGKKPSGTSIQIYFFDGDGVKASTAYYLRGMPVFANKQDAQSFIEEHGQEAIINMMENL